jgi:hypothetical protein
MPTFHTTATKALHIQQEDPNTNFGSNVIMRLHRRPGTTPKESRVLMRFNMYSIPRSALITDAKLFLDFEGTKKSDFIEPFAEPPPQAAVNVYGRSFMLRYLTQDFTQEGASWNRYAKDRSDIRAATSSSTSGMQFPSSSWSSLVSEPFMHQWPGGAGAYGDTIADGQVVGTLPTTNGIRIIDITDLATYAHESGGDILRLYLACGSDVHRGLWKISGIQDPLSSSMSSVAAVEPRIEVQWSKDDLSSEPGTSGTG